MLVVSGDIDDAELEAVAALFVGYRGVFWGMVVWLESVRVLGEGFGCIVLCCMWGCIKLEFFFWCYGLRFVLFFFRLIWF